MREYKGNAYKMGLTHQWVEEQLRALYVDTSTLAVLSTEKKRHAVLLNGKTLFTCDPAGEVLRFNNGDTYNRQTKVLRGHKDRATVKAELIDIIKGVLNGCGDR